jgi:hypothetical protein
VLWGEGLLKHSNELLVSVIDKQFNDNLSDYPILKNSSAPIDTVDYY